MKARSFIAAYYAMIELLDFNIGRILNALEETDKLKETIIIFMSDHGECLGDHGLVLKGYRFYEGLTRIPLIFSCAESFQTSLRSQALVELIDIMPMILEVCGIPYPERIHGKSLLPILKAELPPIHHRDSVCCEYYRTLNPSWRPHFYGSYGTMFRDRRYNLSVYHGHDAGELYDLEEDPGEFNNLWFEPEARKIKFNLIKQSFERLALAIDLEPEQTVRW